MLAVARTVVGVGLTLPCPALGSVWVMVTRAPSWLPCAWASNVFPRGVSEKIR